MDSSIEQSVDHQKLNSSARDELLRDFHYRVDTPGTAGSADSDSLQGQIAAHGTDFVKTALLFMPMSGKLGKAATVATGLVYSLSEIDTREGATLDNFGRGLMGLGKGLGTRYAINKIGSAESVNFAARGVTMALATRAIDVTCSPGTYWDSSGQFSPTTAAQRMKSVLLDEKALGMDFLVVGLAHIPTSFTNRLTGPSFADPLVKNMQMGASFGLATGTLTELERQQRSPDPFDVQKLAWSALSRAGLDALAAAPGGLYGRRLAAASALHHAEASANQTPAEAVHHGLSNAALKPGIDLGSLSFSRNFEPASPLDAVKHFVVTGGDFRPILDPRGRPAQLTVQELDGRGRAIGSEQSLLLGHHDQNRALGGSAIDRETRIATCNPQLLPESLRARHLFPNSQGDVFFGADGRRITLATSLSLLPAEASVKIALGEQSPWRNVTEMLRDPLVINNIVATSARFNRAFDPARLERWAQEVAGQKDLVPECAIYDGSPYGYFVGGEQLTIPLHPLVAGQRYGPVLKMSTLDFRKSWGYREFPMGFKDAEVLDGPYRMTMRGGEFNHWYLQERAESFGFHQMDLVSDFEAKVRGQGRYCFWDYKVDQFGFKLDKNGRIKTDRKGNEQVVVLDYNAVVRAGSSILNVNEPRPEKR